MSKPWNVPAWFAPEDTERYEKLVEALHDVVRAIRGASERVNPARESEISAWEARVTAITREADEWAERVNRLLRATDETPIVGREEVP